MGVIRAERAQLERAVYRLRGHAGKAYHGVDIINFPGSLIQNNVKLVRLNQYNAHFLQIGARFEF